MPISRTTNNMSLGIPQDKQLEVVANIYEDSAIMQLADVRQMTAPTQEIVSMGTFNWAAGMNLVAEASAKPESDGGLTSATITANKLATGFIVSDELLADSDIDLIEFYEDAITQRMAYLIDQMALGAGANSNGAFGTANLATAATTAAGNHVQTFAGTFASPTVAIDKFTAAYNAVEADDFVPDGWLVQRPLKGALRSLTQSGGLPLLAENFQGDVPDNLWGEPVYFLGRGVFPASAASVVRAIVGDFTQYVIGVRDELTFSLHNEGTFNGRNLLERNETLLRAEMRIGAAVLSNAAFARINLAAT
jgi:HK97 family phage major capsid protein